MPATCSVCCLQQLNFLSAVGDGSFAVPRTGSDRLYAWRVDLRPDAAATMGANGVALNLPRTSEHGVALPWTRVRHYVPVTVVIGSNQEPICRSRPMTGAGGCNVAVLLGLPTIVCARAFNADLQIKWSILARNKFARCR